MTAESYNVSDYAEFLGLYDRAYSGESLRIVTDSELGKRIVLELPRLRGASELEFSLVHFMRGTVIVQGSVIYC